MGVNVKELGAYDRGEEESEPELARDVPVGCRLYATRGQSAANKTEIAQGSVNEHLVGIALGGPRRCILGQHGNGILFRPALETVYNKAVHQY